ncbi:MAG TPA: sigma-70 family RNA polymerase sigma factor [Candidatus Polarisedimenticolia bacterium]|nr:sigma-70 family RNA polymerase sigma factor [Candidatus Polarisedimenticolia bacterium]
MRGGPRDAAEGVPGEGDAGRFLALVQAHRRVLYKIAGVYGRTAADRQDLAQEIVLALWRSFERYDADRPFATWMYRVALNVAISRHRSDRRRRRDLVDDGEAVIAIAAAAPERAALEGEIGRLHDAIASLDELDRALVLLHLEGERHEAIGAVLGITESNVGTRLARIKERLRRRLQPGASQEEGGTHGAG